MVWISAARSVQGPSVRARAPGAGPPTAVRMRVAPQDRARRRLEGWVAADLGPAGALEPARAALLSGDSRDPVPPQGPGASRPREVSSVRVDSPRAARRPSRVPPQVRAKRPCARRDFAPRRQRTPTETVMSTSHAAARTATTWIRPCTPVNPNGARTGSTTIVTALPTATIPRALRCRTAAARRRRPEKTARTERTTTATGPWIATTPRASARSLAAVA